MIAARTGLMAQGLTSTKGQDFKELSLMSSEKTEAMSASADAMAASAGAIGQRLGRAAMDEGAQALAAAAAARARLRLAAMAAMVARALAAAAAVRLWTPSSRVLAGAGVTVGL